MARWKCSDCEREFYSSRSNPRPWHKKCPSCARKYAPEILRSRKSYFRAIEKKYGKDERWGSEK